MTDFLGTSSPDSLGPGTLNGGNDNDSIVGIGGADSLFGGGGNDILFGGGGADRLFGGTGNDSLFGGNGNDSADGGQGDDLFVFEGTDGGDDNDTLIGGEGGEILGDTLDLSSFATAANVNFTGVDAGNARIDPPGGEEDDILFSQFERFILTGQADTFTGGAATGPLFVDAGAGADSIVGGSGADTFFGGADADTLSGGVDADSLSGGAGADSLSGGSGADSLAGGADADTIIGGVGSDWVDYSASAAGVNVNLGDSATEQGGDAQGDSIVGVENIIGSNQADSLTGTDGSNIIVGGGGADSITGAYGSDSILGGDGDDTIDAGPDTPPVVTPPADANLTFQWVSAGRVNNQDVEAGISQDVEVSPGVGMRVDVTYTEGSAASQFLLDTDSIYQFAGETYNVNSSVEVRRPGGPGITEVTVDFSSIPNSGFADEVTNVTFAITDIDEAGWLDQVTILAYDANGNIVPVSISEVGVNPDLDIVGNTVTAVDNGASTAINQPDGAILVEIAGPVSSIVIQYGDLLSDTQRINISDVQFTAVAATPENSDADTVDGGIGNDVIQAGLGTDSLAGGAGNDSILGEADHDTLQGGEGLDTLYGGAGNDLLQGGADQDSLYGDAGNDTLQGDAANDTLVGGLGADSQFGGEGNDLFFVADGDVDTLTGTEFIDGGGTIPSPATDFDTINLTEYGWARVDIAYTGGNPANESGTISLFALDGTTLIGTINFTEIEQIIPCFTPGTMILTDRGEVAVESLQPGDMVMTRDNGLQPLRWIGQRKLSRLQLLADPDLQPVRIARGALSGQGPDRTMLVSPQHRVLMTGARAELLFGEDEVLVPAKHLVGLAEVTRALPEDGVTYVHILFDRHEIVQSDGIWTESFQPAQRMLNAMDAAVRAEVLGLFPELAEGAEGYPAARLSLKAHEARVLLGR